MSENIRKDPSWKERLGQWGAYAAASGAALSMSTNASAAIVYSGVIDKTAELTHLSGAVLSTKTVALSGLFGGLAFLIRNIPNAGSGRQASVVGEGNFYDHINGGLADAAVKFALGSSIKGITADIGGLRVHFHSGSQAGLWGPNTVTGFAGFVLGNGDKGWVDVEVLDRNHDMFPDEIEVISWAYNNVPGGAITAGATGVPEPGTAALGLLAAGAAGLLALRRRRTATQ